MQGKYLPTALVLNAIEGNNNVEKLTDADGETIIGAAVPMMNNKTVTGVIYYQTSAADSIQFMNQIWATMLMLAVLVSLLTGVVSFVMAGFITAPIRELTEKLGKAADDGSDCVLETNTGGEIKAAGICFKRFS